MREWGEVKKYQPSMRCIADGRVEVTERCCCFWHPRRPGSLQAPPTALGCALRRVLPCPLLFFQVWSLGKGYRVSIQIQYPLLWGAKAPM